MYIKSIFLVSSLMINLGSVSPLSSEEIQVNQQRSSSTLLNDYYNEFTKPYAADEKCNCDSESEQIINQNSLTNYYSEFLSK